MILCTYTNDLGFSFKNIPVKLIGIDTSSNEFLSPNEIIATISLYIPTDGYLEISKKVATCGMRGRKRRLLMEIGSKRIDAEYYQPFSAINWNSLDLTIKIETIPEFINNGDLAVLLRDIYG